MAKQKRKAKLTKQAAKKKAKRAAKRPGRVLSKFPAIASAMADDIVIIFRRGDTIDKWEPGEHVQQVMRDLLEKNIPPLTKAESAALEAKRRLHTELSGSVKAEPNQPPVETRTRRTTAELLGAPTNGIVDEQAPVKAGRPDLVG